VVDTRWSRGNRSGYYSRVTSRFVVLALLLGLATGGEAAPAAPGFKVRLIDGRTTLDSRDLIGKKILVLRFQASYCKTCVREAPALGRLFDKYRSRDVEVVAVHVQDTAADTRAFVRRFKAPYPVALDPKLTIGNSFGFKGTPYTVVIDRRGEMVSQIHGASAVSRLPRILDELLKDNPPPSS
jgi:peroxiredoxin